MDTKSKDPNSLAQVIRNTKQYGKTLRLLEDIQTDFDIDKLELEVLEYQQIRSERDPLALKKRPERYIVQYSSEDNAYRSRVSYVKSLCRKTSFKVEWLLESCRNWIFSSYGSRMQGTAQVKSSLVETLVEPLSEYLNQLNSLEDSCNICIEDIDQCQWQRKAVVSVLEIQTRPESKI